MRAGVLDLVPTVGDTFLPAAFLVWPGSSCFQELLQVHRPSHRRAAGTSLRPRYSSWESTWGSTLKASASLRLVLGLAGRLPASRSAIVALDTPDFSARSS